MTTTAKRALIAAWGLFASVFLLLFGRGLIGVLLGVRAELEQFTTTTTGVVMAAYFAGFLAGAQITPRVMARVGHIRVFSGYASVVAAAALIHALWVIAPIWAVTQLVYGFCMAGLFVVAESWLNESVTNDNRGRVMAMYMVVNMGGVAIGQFSFGLGDPTGPVMFMIVAGATSLAVVPVTLSIASAPEFKLPPRQNPRAIWEAAPVGVVGALAAGFGNSALLGLAAVYALQVGMSNERTALFVGAAAVGAVIMQWPIGYASDYMGRRRMIVVVAASATAIALVGLGLPVDGWEVIVAMFVFGGLSYTMYSLALSHVIDVLPAGQAVTASSTNIFLTGVGAIFGPIAASVAMTAIGPNGFWWTLAAAFASIAVFSLYRLIRRPKIEGIDRQPYLAVPARSGGVLRLVRRNGSRK